MKEMIRVPRDNQLVESVIYDEEKQRLHVRTLLQDVLAENLSESGKQGKPIGGNLVTYLFRYAPILKHKSFEEEHEWRIITKPLNCSNDRFEFRPGGSMLIPYFRLPLAGQRSLDIQEIIIGPTPHPAQSLQSVNSLLKHGFPTWSLVPQEEVVTLRRSEVPYRNW